MRDGIFAPGATDLKDKEGLVGAAAADPRTDAAHPITGNAVQGDGGHGVMG